MKNTLLASLALVIALAACSVTKQSNRPITRSLEGSDFAIYPENIVTNKLKRNSSCPGDYRWEAIYSKPATNGWGWATDTNAIFIVASITNRSDIHITYAGQYGDSGCSGVNANIPSPAASPFYRFQVWGTNNPPATTNDLPMNLHGFLP